MSCSCAERGNPGTTLSRSTGIVLPAAFFVSLPCIGGGAGGGVASKEGASEAVEYRVRGSSGDSACGGLDMDYKVARALLVSRARIMCVIRTI